jgi:prolyl-tRNA synthetase
MVCGANRDDYHLRHVTPGEDFEPEFRDLREVVAGEACVRCGAGLELRPAVELARLAPDVHGLSLERILTTAIELGSDKDGMILPAAIAPFDVVVTAAVVSDGAEQVYRECLAAGLDAVYDDRDERAGVKFKDADLIGVPLRINVGKKLADGLVEVVERKTKQSVDVPMADAAVRVRAAILSL